MLVVSNEQMRKLLVALLVVVNVTFAYISWGSHGAPERPGNVHFGKARGGSTSSGQQPSRLLAEDVAVGGEPAGNARETVMKLVSVSLDRHPLAVCNDGQGAAYYFQGGRGEGLSTWLVFLEGGGWCWDAATCAARWAESPGLMSPPTAPTRTATGLLSSDPARSPLALANKVYLKYCSSDAHVGDRAASPETHGWHFRGAQIVRATLAQLSELHGLAAADTLYLAGCSAGGRGAMFTLDYAEEMLPLGVKVLGILDAPMWVEQGPLARGAMPFANQTAQLLALAGAHGRLGPACAPLHPRAPWRCLFGQFRAPTLARPFLMAASQADSFQLSNNLGHGPPFGPGPEEEAVEDFRRKVQKAMRSLSATTAAAFSFECYGHCSTEGDQFWTRVVREGAGGNVTLFEFVSRWIASGHAGAQAVETCASEFNCGCAASGTQQPRARGAWAAAGLAGAAAVAVQRR